MVATGACAPNDLSRLAAKRLRCELLEDRRLLAAIIVDSPSDVAAADGMITLREAILAANEDAIADATEGTQAGSESGLIRFAPWGHDRDLTSHDFRTTPLEAKVEASLVISSKILTV